MKKIIAFIQNYLADIITLVGIIMLSYNIFRPPTKSGVILPNLTTTDYHTEWKVLGIVLVALGIDIAIRKYLQSKNR